MSMLSLGTMLLSDNGMMHTLHDTRAFFDTTSPNNVGVGMIELPSENKPVFWGVIDNVSFLIPDHATLSITILKVFGFFDVETVEIYLKVLREEIEEMVSMNPNVTPLN